MAEKGRGGRTFLTAAPISHLPLPLFKSPKFHFKNNIQKHDVVTPAVYGRQLLGRDGEKAKQ
jgi:hypothetical protein